jgi:predicted O-methyltransferase YrrM
MLSEKLEEYAKLISDAELPVLQRLNRETNAKILRPRMLSGHLQGKLLEFISTLKKPRRILEIGTYTGYSAICLAKGLTHDGLLHTIDKNPELEEFTRAFIVEAGLEKKIIQHVGEALEVIPTINERFDLAFIDADKENYVNYLEMILEKLEVGGIILADNVLWDGKVVMNPIPDDSETQGIVAFNEHVKNRKGIKKFILPFRDGLMIIEKC